MAAEKTNLQKFHGGSNDVTQQVECADKKIRNLYRPQRNIFRTHKGNSHLHTSSALCRELDQSTQRCIEHQQEVSSLLQHVPITAIMCGSGDLKTKGDAPPCAKCKNSSRSSQRQPHLQKHFSSQQCHRECLMQLVVLSMPVLRSLKIQPSQHASKRQSWTQNGSRSRDDS